MKFETPALKSFLLWQVIVTTSYYGIATEGKVLRGSTVKEGGPMIDHVERK
jgi:hypothetical protein